MFKQYCSTCINRVKAAAFLRTLEFVFLIRTVEGKSCTYYKTDSYYSYNSYYMTYARIYRKSTDTIKYCSYSCCTYDCCIDYRDIYTYYRSAITAGAIVGIVIGCLVAIAVIVSLIVVCCICMRRNQRQPGQIVTAGGQPVTYITSNQQVANRQVIGGSAQQNPQTSYAHATSNPSYTYPPVVGTPNTVNPNLVGTSNVGYTQDTAVPPTQYETLKQ